MFLQSVKDNEPLIAIMENVQGFIQYCKQLREPPIKPYLRHAEALGLFSLYAIKIVIADSKHMLVMQRPRVYVLFMHNKCGGARAMQLASTYMMACV